MSRLIVKNLPNGVRRSFNTLWYFSRNQNVPKIKAENVKKTGNPVENKLKLFEKLKEERLRKLFGEQGEVTDCSLKYTRSGQFRNFAFIGYKNEKDAQTALDRLNQTYIDTKKIQIEVARDFGDANKPRAWSKYSKESSANQRLAQESSANQKNSEESSANQKKAKKSSANRRTAEENQIDNNEEDSNRQPSKKKKKKKRKENEALIELKDDAGFQEFLEVHQNVSAKPVWTNDGGKAKKSQKEESEMAVDSDDYDNDDDGEDDIVGHGDEEDVEDEDITDPRRYDHMLKGYKWKTEGKPWLKETRITPERCSEIHIHSLDGRVIKKVKERQKELGQPLRKGKWSAGEDDILVENLQRYYKEYPLYNPLLLLHFGRCNPKFFRALKETLLYSRIAEGLNRTTLDAYVRLKFNLFPRFALKTGKYSVEEEIHLRKLYGIYGPKWKTISFYLERSERTIVKKWDCMRATKFGEWDTQEDQLLIEAVKHYAKNDKDLHNKLPWVAIAKNIPGRSAIHCRNHWMYKLRNKVLQEESCFQTIDWKDDQNFELVSQICEQNVDKEEDVDFDHIRKHFQKTGFIVTRKQVRKQWNELKTKVRSYYIKSFSEILDEVACLVTDT